MLIEDKNIEPTIDELAKPKNKLQEDLNESFDDESALNS